MNRFRWGTIALVVLVGATVLVAGHVRRSLAKLPPLRTTPLIQRDLTISIDITGVVEPKELVEVGAEVAGTITGFGDDLVDSTHPIEVGTQVKKGQVLVQLDKAVYDLELEKANAAFHLAAAEVTSLETRLQQAKRDYERAQRLRATNSESQFDKATTALTLAQNELTIAETRREQMSATVRQAELRLNRTTIRSPVDGVVIDQKVKLGQRVGLAGAGLILLARDLSSMQIRASVSETDIGKVHVGQKVTFSVDAYRNRKMTGSVQKILMNARVQGNFVTYNVIISPDETTESLLPHMTADVQLHTAFRKNAWLVPTDSLQWWPSKGQFDDGIKSNDPGTDVVAGELKGAVLLPKAGELATIWVPKGDGKVARIEVRVGITDGVQTEITGGDLKRKMPIVVGTIRETTLARIIPNIKTLR